MIKAGRIKLNSQVVRELGTRAVWGRDSIRLDGREIPGPSDRIYIMLNKPFGYICSLDDPAGRPLAVDLLEGVTKRLYSVGRLDFDSLGLLLFTNDGEFSHRLTHPRYHLPRTYKVTVSGTISDQSLRSLANGIPLEDGASGPAKVVLLTQHQGRSIIRLTITQGRTRIVRRMFEAVGYRIIHLIRTGFGCLELGGLKIGDYRHLEAQEVQVLKKMVGLE